MTKTEALRILRLLLADTQRVDSVFVFGDVGVRVEQIEMALMVALEVLETEKEG